MDTSWNSIRTGITPPPPSSAENSRALENVGRTLLSLVRSLDKSDEENCNVLVQDIADILKNLIAIYSRRGLLQGDSDAAEKILSASGSASGRREKRKSRKGGAGKDLQMYNQDDKPSHNGETNKSGGVQDETLVLSALVRILDCGKRDREASSTSPIHDLTLVAMAAQVISSICERIKLLLLRDTCTSAENELLATHVRSLLTGLSATTRSVLASIVRPSLDKEGSHKYVGFFMKENQPRASNGTRQSEHEVQALSSCLLASATLLSHFGTRLSRSSTLLSDLSVMGWSALTVPNEHVQRSAAAMLASIPLTGGVSKKTPGTAWNAAIVEATAAISRLLNKAAPLRKQSKDVNHIMHMSKDVQDSLNGWIDLIRGSLNNQGQRGKAFHSLMNGLVKYLCSLLGRDGYDSGSQFTLVSTQVPLGYLLDVSETMISFTTAAESKYFATKKRLRMETINGGFLNPTTVVCDLATFVKSLGLDILDAALQAFGATALFPHGRRLMRIASASLVTSCSGPLRKVLDPTGAAHADGKRRRCLHTAVPMRTRAIKSFKAVVLACGSNAVAVSSTAGEESSRRNDGNMGISIIAGCLLEQVTWKATLEDNVDEDWGSLAERVELVTIAADALAACLAVCRGYMQLSTRQLVDSVASTCLSTLFGREMNEVCSWGSVRTSLLNLGVQCLCTPSSDGATSSAANTVRRAASICKHDCNPSVVAAAYAALSFCHTLAMPRAPPLSFSVSSDPDGVAGDPRHEHTTATTLGEGMRHVKEENTAKTKVQAASLRENKRRKTEDNKAFEGTQANDRAEMPDEEDKSSTTVTFLPASTNIPKMTSSETTNSQNMEATHLSVQRENGIDGNVTMTGNETIENSTDANARKAPSPGTVEEEKSFEVVPPVRSSDADTDIQPVEDRAVEEKVESDSGNESDIPEIFDCGPDNDDV